MIISNQQIAIHISRLRNLSSLNSGRFQFRLALTETHRKQTLKATPVCIIEQLPPKMDNRSEFDDQHITTRIVPLKSSAHVEMREVYVFKLNSAIQGGREQKILTLTVEQIAIEANKQRLVSTYRGVVNGQVEHQYLQVDFYDGAACQLVGSFHRCLYKYDLVAQEKTVDLKKFCEKYYSGKADQIVDYLKNEGARHYQSLVQHSSLIFKEQMEMDCIEIQEPIQFKIMESQMDVDESETEIGSAEEQDHKFTCQKKRQKIFSLTKDYKTQIFLSVERGMHQNAQKMYQLWRQLLQKITTQASSSFLKERATIYRKKLIQKSKESVSSFKGSWDTQLYGEEQSIRNKLASQLRNQNKQYSEELHPSIENQFPIVNKGFFSENRPIIFEEKAVKDKPILEQELQEDLLIILVHGLGACRLDMEKLKVELKRYYEGKMRIFVSAANEGRTEGQIDNMGMRLAHEIDYQISKSSQIPKICLVGHSMGGLIIRSALPRLQKYKKHFHSLVTLSSPHLGYTYSSSTLIDVGLWFMNAVKKCTSIKEMNMSDNDNYQKTYLYKLSQKPGLQWFKKITFLGSHQDLYVPYYSARVQKHKESIVDERGHVKKGKIHCSMADNILSRARGSINRLDVNFCIPEQNLDNFIGRAAHIGFINSSEMVRTFVLAGKHYFF